MATTKSQDITKVLKSDHDELRGLFEKMEATTERAATKRRELLARIATEIRSHATAEEEVLYRQFRKRAEEDEQEEMYYEAREEHHVVDLVLPELEQLDPTTPEFTAKATVLKELIEHHAKEEEKEMFKMVRELFDADERRSMGERFLERKRELVSTERSRGRNVQRPAGRARSRA